MKKNKKLTYKTGLKKNIVNKEVFDKEVTLCKNLSKENNGRCGWGRCKDCGVIPLLYKLYKGQLLEEPAEIEKTKKDFLK